MAIHVGKLIKKRLQETGMSKTEFGRRINRTSQNVYDIFKRKSLDTALLLTICEILQYDFFHPHSMEYARISATDKSTVTEEPKETYLTSSELLRELESCKQKLDKCSNTKDQLQKEVAYLKEINELLKKK